MLSLSDWDCYPYLIELYQILTWASYRVSYRSSRVAAGEKRWKVEKSMLLAWRLHCSRVRPGERKKGVQHLVSEIISTTICWKRYISVTPILHDLTFRYKALQYVTFRYIETIPVAYKPTFLTSMEEEVFWEFKRPRKSLTPLYNIN